MKKFSELTNEEQKIATGLFHDTSVGITFPSRLQEEAGKAVLEYFVQKMTSILEPPPLTISFDDHFDSDEERLTHAFPLAAEARKSGLAGYGVASQYFVLAYDAAMRLGRYPEAIAATYGMACSGLRFHEFVENIKSHFPEGSNWFDAHMEKYSTDRAKEFELVTFPTWYKNKG